MSTELECNFALALADTSLWEADGHVVVDQAHDIASKVSTALQQYGRLALVILPFLLSAAAEVRATINKGKWPLWAHVQDKDPHMEAHLFSPKTTGYVKGSTTAPAPAPQVALVPAPKDISIPPIDSLPVTSHQMTNKGK
ncbi:uncharacterized protein BJ212DRAFT_1482121 [Suillus subaureus]|uniref:Uncharacterized protein n=1 Tax=Suillus subaureus TaxID=48587 RepID=A0A9P7E8M4_9AGAM|nr:uncharacterized protein BJ212DRAFT_1482121 [Suillus subaureus]KAG1814386.1 hypothetical protein BJ212DRAFT_1482121 [Suillus subaureus]